MRGWRARLRFLPAIGWMAVIFRLSAIPGSQIPGRYGALGHLVMYAVLGALLAWALAPGPRAIGKRALMIAVVVASLYGVTDEFHQAFVPLRTPDVVDWIVDTIGALLGAGLVLGVTRRFRAEE